MQFARPPTAEVDEEGVTATLLDGRAERFAGQWTAWGVGHRPCLRDDGQTGSRAGTDRHGKASEGEVVVDPAMLASIPLPR